MSAYLAKRLLIMIPTLLGAVTLVFIAIRLTPGDPATVLLGDFATPENVAQLRHQYGLDKPIYVQYVIFVKDSMTLDFGTSYATGESALGQIIRVFPYTIELAVGGLLVSVLIGIPTGVIAAVSKRRGVDGANMVGALALVSVPNFYLGVLLITIFSIHLHLLPITGVGGPGLLSRISHLVLPAIALGGGGAAVIARMMRSSLLEVMGKEYVTTARAKGLRFRSVVIKHALRNAFLPVMTVLGIETGRLLGGSVVIETVFARAGVGKLIIDSITARDYVQVQASVIFLTVLFVVVNLITDLTYAVLDPRIRYS